MFWNVSRQNSSFNTKEGSSIGYSMRSCYANCNLANIQFPVELLRKSELKEWILLVCARSKNLLRANRTIGSRRTHFRNNSTGICTLIPLLPRFPRGTSSNKTRLRLLCYGKTVKTVPSFEYGGPEIGNELQHLYPYVDQIRGVPVAVDPEP
jgi:hypothetical protein